MLQGSIQTPIEVRDEVEHRCFPSALAFVPFPEFDMADFGEALAAHRALYLAHRDTLAFQARRTMPDELDPEEPEVCVDVWLTHRTAIVGQATNGSAPSTHVIPRLAFTHGTHFPWSFRRRVVQSTSGLYVYICAGDAQSLGVAHRVRGSLTRLGPLEVLAVAPRRIRGHRFGNRILLRSYPPRTFVRLDWLRVPTLSNDPDVEMDGLTDLYREDLLEGHQSLREKGWEPPYVGWIRSKRSSGDSALVTWGDASLALNPFRSYRGLHEALAQPAPPGWLPVVVDLEKHYGLRWLALDGAPREDGPDDVRAMVLPWRRAVAV